MSELDWREMVSDEAMPLGFQPGGQSTAAEGRPVSEFHYPLWRDIGYDDADGEVTYEEIKVCAACVPKHSHFRSREDVPDWPAHTTVLSGRQR